MAKTDIELAFRLLQVHPDRFYLLGCHLEGQNFVGPPASRFFAKLRMMEKISLNFGVRLAPEKTEVTATVVKFLRIVIDYKKMEYRLPEDKLGQLKAAVKSSMGKRKSMLRDLQS